MTAYPTPVAELVTGHHLVPLPGTSDPDYDPDQYSADPDDYAVACSCGYWFEDAFAWESHLLDRRAFPTNG